MKKVLLLSALLAVAWGAAMTGWSVAAHLTGAPGPARAANLMFDTGAAALEAVELPRPLSRSRRAAMRQLRLSHRVVLSVLSGPERAGAALAARLSEGHRTRIERVEIVAPNAEVHRPVVIRRGEEPIRIIVRPTESAKSSH